MKIKRLISIVLALSLLFTLTTLNVSAAGKTYTATVSKVITSEYSITPENFSIEPSIALNSIYALDGTSASCSYDILSFKAVYTDLDGNTHTGDYIVSPEEFFAIFSKRDEDIEYTKEYNADKELSMHIKVRDIDLVGEFTIAFEDDGLFGILEYNLLVKGFSSPALSSGGFDLGIDLGGGGDDLMDAVKLPVDVNITGTIDDFPTVKGKPTVISKPAKTVYTDADNFDATGLKLEVTTTDNVTGTFTYSPETDYAFKFNPSNDEKLAVFNTEVITYLNGKEVLKTPITVNHKFSAGYVNITTDKYSETKPGYHAIVCEGCGETHDAQPHIPMNEEWTYNNDHTFVENGTESNTCADCGTIIIRDAFGTAGFNTTFADMHFIKVVFEYINVLLRFIGAATY